MNKSDAELRSPIINKNNSVTLNLKSENAKNVEVTSELVFKTTRATPNLEGVLGGHIPMKKTSKNVWTITSIPMLPGRYAYSFWVDGLMTLDPLNPLIRRVNSLTPFGGSINRVDIPAEKPMPWEFSSDIAHGEIILDKFDSRTFEQVKGCSVYLPPGYEPTKRYPILYLLHGARADSLTWIFSVYADNIMDNLISEKKSKEMIVVMPDGHKGTVGTLIDIAPFLKAHNSEETSRKILEEHTNYFINDVVPFVESGYSVLKEARAIAGLSMGGGQTFNIITTHPDMFSAAGMFSSGMIDDKLLTRLSKVKHQIKQYKLIYVSCGKRDPLLKQSETIKGKLEELEIKYVYYTADTGHVNNFWSRSLADFVHRL
jgi:enterochelin esterase-like enzyme